MPESDAAALDPATTSLRVLHVNDVASVPATLVAAARHAGLKWRLHRIPPARPPWGEAVRGRAADLASSLPLLRRADIIHTHYAPNGYYSLPARRARVLHFHGSDLRQDLYRPGYRQLIRAAVRHADLVLYATPDLGEAARALCPHAVYLPNPLRAGFAEAAHPEPVDRVVFSMRWDDAKGGIGLVHAAAALVAAGIRVDGVAWGRHAEAARAAGVRMHPLMDAPAFRDFLASSRLVVDQLAFPALSMTALQAMSQAVPVIGNAPTADTPIISTSVAGLADAVRAALRHEDETAALARTARTWVLEHHDPARVLARLTELYAKLL